MWNRQFFTLLGWSIEVMFTCYATDMDGRWSALPCIVMNVPEQCCHFLKKNLIKHSSSLFFFLFTTFPIILRITLSSIWGFSSLFLSHLIFTPLVHPPILLFTPSHFHPSFCIPTLVVSLARYFISLSSLFSIFMLAVLI